MEPKSSDIALKRQLIEATDAVRKKFNLLKQNAMTDQQTLEKLYEPITKSIKMMTTSKMNSPTNIKTSNTSANNQNNVPRKPKKFPPLKWPSTPELYQSSSTPETKKDENYSQLYTPPTSSLDNTLTETESTYQNEDENASDLVKFHLSNVISGNKNYDRIYGVRNTDNKFYMGKYEVRFENDEISVWSRGKRLQTFNGSPELYELIFLKDPHCLDSKDLSNNDIKNYGKLMYITNAPYQQYDIRKGLNVSRTRKFPFIANLTPSPHSLRKQIKKGSGISKKISQYKEFNKNPIDYTYWNSVQELIERLRLLWSSKMAGNTGVDNEILSIIEELREEGVIY